MSRHTYRATATWTGNTGQGTTGPRDYARDTRIRVEGKPDLLASADRPFRGDPSRWNPEDLLLAALAECHLLAYLHACATRGVVVTSYVDEAAAELEVEGNAGRFVRAVLRPRATVSEEEMVADALRAHDDAHAWCFIANSVSFPIEIVPEVTSARAAGPV